MKNTKKDLITKRFLEFIEILKLTKQVKTDSELADRLRVSKGYFPNLKGDRAEVGIDPLIELHKQFNANLNWIITGMGDKHIGGKNINISKEGKFMEERVELLEEGFKTISGQVLEIKQAIAKLFNMKDILINEIVKDKSRVTSY